MGDLWNRSSFHNDWDNPAWAVAGIIDPFEAASLLSHRHASRNGDDVVIWSLICSRSVYYTAKDLWVNEILRKERMIPSGFLISSLPRLRGEKGLSWAPSRPGLPPTSDNIEFTKGFPAFSSILSRMGTFTGTGLRAVWLKCFVKCPAIFDKITVTQDSAMVAATTNRIADIVSQYLGSFLWGSLLRPVVGGGRTDHGDNFDDIDDYVPFAYEGDADGPLLAIVGSNDCSSDEPQWEWIGVYEWVNPVPLPLFKPGFVILV